MNPPLPEHMRGHWHPACLATDLRTSPRAVTIAGRSVVLFRSEDHIAALDDCCPHRNVPLSSGRLLSHGVLQCCYHGWEFDRSGCCVRVPGLCDQKPVASRDVAAFEARELHGLIWLRFPDSNRSPKEPYAPPLADSPDHDWFVWSTVATGSLMNVAENFLDGTHTHYVHSGLIRTDAHRQRIKATLRLGGDRVEVQYSGEGKQSGLISRLFESDRSLSFGRFIRPSIAELEYRSAKATTMMITAYLTPQEDEEHHAVHAVIALQRGLLPGWLKRMVVSPFIKLALKQDLDVLDLQRGCIASRGGEQFTFTELDLIRPGIQRLLQSPESDLPTTEREVELEL